jgi:F-box protein 9
VPVGAVLEMTYYRYLYFQEDGRVLYALTVAPPHEMFRRFLKVCLSREADPDAVWGAYQVQKTSVLIEAKQSWQFVRLELSIRPEITVNGKYGYLSFDGHMSSSSGNFDEWSHDRVVYEVPEEPFRFIRNKRL